MLRIQPRERSNVPVERNGIQASLSDLVALGERACRLEFAPSRGANDALAGPYPASSRGSGIEFDELRAYLPGDDVRCIDWRVTARTGRPHSRVFREERERPVWIFVDAGPGMHFGTRCAFKSVRAAWSAAEVAWTAREQGDRVGAVVRGTEVTHTFPPKRREADFFGLLDCVAAATQIHGEVACESLDEALGRLAARIRPGDRVYVISDFEGLSEVGRRHLSQIGRRADATCVLIYDVLEACAPPPGDYRITDGDDVCSVPVGRHGARDQYASLFDERLESLAEFCRARRIGLVALRTDEEVSSRVGEVFGAGDGASIQRRASR
jgi:uncharacterized protein (DUF58 family)